MRSNPNIKGRFCIVRDTKTTTPTLVEAIVIDCKLPNESHRVRLQTGEHFGEVRKPGEYQLMEFASPGEAPEFIAAAWADGDLG